MTAWLPRFRMPAFSCAILAMVSPRYSTWSMLDRRDDAAQRMIDDVGGVEASAQPDFEQQIVGRHFGKEQERSGGGDLEIGDRPAGIGRLAALKRVVELPARHQRAGQPDALVEAHQMGRGVDVHALARRLEEGAQIGDGRALAVGAGDMDHRRQPVLRPPEIVEQPQLALEVQVDQLGVQRQQALQDGIGAGHRLEIPASSNRTGSFTQCVGMTRAAGLLGVRGLGLVGDEIVVASRRRASAMLGGGVGGAVRPALRPWSGWRRASRWWSAGCGGARPCRPCRARRDIRSAGSPWAAFRGWSAR